MYTVEVVIGWPNDGQGLASEIWWVQTGHQGTRGELIALHVRCVTILRYVVNTPSTKVGRDLLQRLVLQQIKIANNTHSRIRVERPETAERIEPASL